MYIDPGAYVAIGFHSYLYIMFRIDVFLFMVFGYYFSIISNVTSLDNFSWVVALHNIVEVEENIILLALIHDGKCNMRINRLRCLYS